MPGWPICRSSVEERSDWKRHSGISWNILLTSLGISRSDRTCRPQIFWSSIVHWCVQLGCPTLICWHSTLFLCVVAIWINQQGYENCNWFWPKVFHIGEEANYPRKKPNCTSQCKYIVLQIVVLDVASKSWPKTGAFYHLLFQIMWYRIIEVNEYVKKITLKVPSTFRPATRKSQPNSWMPSKTSSIRTLLSP